ncbi:MAG: PorT family protein [Sphingobacteriaceae bacterium]|nr:MAG: PorT family protein [Sphingobacteriaceae bacterium]
MFTVFATAFDLNIFIKKLKIIFMKNLKLYLLSASMLLTVNLFAQKFKTSGVSYGVKAGINIANIAIEPSDATVSQKSIIGFNAGVFATLPIALGFAIQPELLYSGLGTRATTGGQSVDIKLDYITLPVLAKYKIIGTGLGIYIGPQVGYILSSKAKAGGVSVDVDDSFKKADFSGIGGVDYALPLGLSLSARYQLGLVNIAKEASGDESAKNNAFTLSLGFSF